MFCFTQVGICNEISAEDIFKVLSDRINKTNYTHAYLIRIPSYDRDSDKMYLSYDVTDSVWVEIKNNNLFKKVSAEKLTFYRVKSHSYLVFLFQEKKSEGLVLHYHESYGEDTLKLFPAVRTKGLIMISGGFKNVTRLQKKDIYYGVKIDNWEKSMIHKKFLKEIKNEKEQHAKPIAR